MYSGTRKLGESQEPGEDVQDTDLETISSNYLSPDSGYPRQRISDYDLELVQHQTLNGVGAWHPTGGMRVPLSRRITALQSPPVSRLPAPFRRDFLAVASSPLVRTRFGAPRNAPVVNPRTNFIRGLSAGRFIKR